MYADIVKTANARIGLYVSQSVIAALGRAKMAPQINPKYKAARSNAKFRNISAFSPVRNIFHLDCSPPDYYYADYFRRKHSLRPTFEATTI